MSTEFNALLTERESDIARLRAAFGFSEVEARDFLDLYGPLEPEMEQAA